MKNILSSDIEVFLQKETTKNFLTSAQKFIEFLENNNLNKNDFLQQIHGLLLELYLKGFQFEEIGLNHSNSNTDLINSDEDIYINLSQTLNSVLGEDAYYREIFDPISDKEENSVQGWLVDDFSDIYRDLKIELDKIKIGTDETIEDALWSLKWSFLNHWGQHCVNAIRALHFLPYEGKLIM
ncbi:MAG: DUF5063 domain-containing protein [Bacteroidetes bacterium]|nr:DUF5063 domain-containing protein [Bacteroidota bacterium]